MTSKTIYQPFTYCITFILTGQRYYGSRYANNKTTVAHPDQLWTTYFTSSKVIKSLIKEHGKESFTFQVRRTFTTRKETVAWETKFLTKIDAAKNPDWLNGNNGDRNFHSTKESIQKIKDTKKERGIVSIFSLPFLSIIDSKKVYSKGLISRYHPEFKQFYCYTQS